MTAHSLEFEHSGITLAGTLHTPDGSGGAAPAVLMLQGSGPSDRDADGYFTPLREAFLERGIAVYSFDRPGCGTSTGNWRHYALFGRAEQAEAALQVLRNHPSVDAQRVGIFGHSQGAWLVQLIASRTPDLAFGIANSGPGITPAEQDLYGVEHTLLAEGRSTEDAAKGVAFTRKLHTAAARGDSFETVSRELLEPARGEPWSSYLSIDSADDWGLICLFAGEHYDPAQALTTVHCPFLAVFGDLDPLLPAFESARICAESLRAARNPDATIVVFPGANHRIRLPETGAFAPGYLDLLADWAARRVFVRGT